MLPTLCRCIPVMRCRRIVAIAALRERIEVDEVFFAPPAGRSMLAVACWLPSKSLSAPAKDQSRIEAEQKAPGKVLPDLDRPGPLPIPVPPEGVNPGQPPSGVEAPSVEDPSAGEGRCRRHSARRDHRAHRRHREAGARCVHRGQGQVQRHGARDYKSLEQFVRDTDVGKQFDADIKKFGFESVTPGTLR